MSNSDLKVSNEDKNSIKDAKQEFWESAVKPMRLFIFGLLLLPFLASVLFLRIVILRFI